MTGSTRKILIALGILAIGALIVVGCGGSSNGTGRLQVSLVDAPYDAEEINIVIKSVDVHKSGGSWWTLKQWDTPIEVNLLEYAGDNPPLLLADAPLSAGHYTKVRLMLESAEIIIGGQSYDVDLRNVEQNGVQCNGEFTVEDGQLCAIIMDFNAGRSFVNNPPESGNFMLQPTLTMSPVNIAAELFGKVEVKDQADAAQPIPEDAVINVYAAGHIGEEAYLISSADVDAGTDPLIGEFSFAVLPQGTYDLQIVLDGTAVKDITGQVVVSPETDLGTITVTLE